MCEMNRIPWFSHECILISMVYMDNDDNGIIRKFHGIRLEWRANEIWRVFLNSQWNTDKRGFILLFHYVIYVPMFSYMYDNPYDIAFPMWFKFFFNIYPIIRNLPSHGFTFTWHHHWLFSNSILAVTSQNLWQDVAGDSSARCSPPTIAIENGHRNSWFTHW